VERVAIVGLGLIGGSLGMALRERVPGVTVIGVARRPESALAAQERGVVDQASTDLADVASAEVVVLACPLHVTRTVLQDMRAHLAEGAVVTDVGSVKGAVLEQMAACLDFQRNPFIGGHPMAGKEVAGVEHAEASLFEGRPWIFTPNQEEIEAVGALADWIATPTLIGARPVLHMRPDSHDRYVALISHLPFLLSSAFLVAAGRDRSWSEAEQLASSGFKDVTRLGAGDPAMYAAIVEANREHVLDTWAALHAALDEFEAAIAREGHDALLQLFQAARDTRNDWEATAAH
jgi:prephenate dehydrogenase